MKFWNFSTQTLAALLASVSIINAGGPASGDAIADPNSAVVKLTTDSFQSFIQENPLVLAEFFAPWCGYCKSLGPEFSKAADSLNESHPNIKLAQVDCTEEADLCSEQGIRGYPTLKVLRGEATEDYEGPRDSNGIAEYMIKQTLPAVQDIESVDQLSTVLEEQSKPFVVQVLGSKVDESANSTYYEVASEKRKDLNFISLKDSPVVDEFNKKINVNLNKLKNNKYLLVHPSDYKDVREFSEKSFSKEGLTTFIANEVVPYFGDINRDTYLMYMSSPVPLGYYFYNSEEERAKVEPLFNKLGKENRGKINFVGLDANLFGRHAEILNMNPEIVPLFAIQDIQNNKKYGIDQSANPNGPSDKTISQFIKDFNKGKLSPIVKSEDLPTDEEKQSQSVVKLVGHNHDAVLKNLDKDVFVKYYAPWCGHCKRLAPSWEELASIYGSNETDSKVVIANLDHTANDVDTPVEIEGYPTLLLYPANGKVDAKTGLREAVVFEGPREIDSLIEFIQEKGGAKVDGKSLKQAKESAAAEEEEVVGEDEENTHDEL